MWTLRVDNRLLRSLSRKPPDRISVPPPLLLPSLFSPLHPLPPLSTLSHPPHFCPILPSVFLPLFSSSLYLFFSITSLLLSFLRLVSLPLISFQQAEKTKCPRAPMFFGLSLLMTLALHLFTSTTNEQASEVSNSTYRRGHDSMLVIPPLPWS